MSQHPVNLAVRFLLELIALGGLGVWGWGLGSAFWRYVFMIGIPLAGAAAWGIFRVPDDPGPPLVQVAGWLRLLIEYIYFRTAVWGFHEAGHERFAWWFGILVVIHYLASYDRVMRLFNV